MRIIVDAMGGDNAPLAIVEGALDAAKDGNLNIVLVGDESKIGEIIASRGACPANVTVHHAAESVTMEDDPLGVLRTKKDSSMAVSLRMLQSGDGDAVVSAGNTGALLFAATHYVRTVHGVRRAPIATILPLPHPVLLLDSGANLGYHTDYDVQWAVMGSIYMKNAGGVENPRVALLNNGTEPTKGVPEVADAYKLLAARDDINFIGNVESRDIPAGVCDVLVTDGFTGNIVIKLMEGMGTFFKETMNDVFSQTVASRLGYLTVRGSLHRTLHSLSSECTGGAPILRLRKPVIKAHGNSNAAAAAAAIRQAAIFASSGAIEAVAAAAPSFTDVDVPAPAGV